MKLLYLPLLIILYLVPASFADPIDNVANLIRQSNIRELSKLFAPGIEITIQGEGGVYSTAQAEVVVDKFFSENKPVAVKVLHKVNSNPGFQLGVLILTTIKGTFRIAYTLKGAEGNLKLIVMRIESDKVK